MNCFPEQVAGGGHVAAAVPALHHQGHAARGSAGGSLLPAQKGQGCLVALLDVLYTVFTIARKFQIFLGNIRRISQQR